MPPHILKMLIKGEDEILDFKQTISSASKIAKTMVAFANHKGGTLLVGIRDNKTVAGIRTEDEKYMLDLAASFFCKPEVKIEIEEWEIEGKLVLECRVLQGEDKPYYSKDEEGNWWAYIRVADKSLLASKVVVDVLKRQNQEHGTKINYSSKEKALFEYLTANEKITLKQYSKMLNLSRYRASKILVNLISTGLIRNHTTEKTEFYTLS